MSGESWIKLYRKVQENGWLHNPVLWTFMTYCLLKASYKERKALIGYQWVNILPGQFIFGRLQAAAELKMSERQIRTCLDRLKASNTITVRSTNKFSIITIVNWNTYQSCQAEGDQQTGQQTVIQVTSQRPASDQQPTTDKKEEKEEKGNNSRKTKTLGDDSILPDWLPTVSWEAYLEMRRKKGRPLNTEHGKNLAIAKLTKLRDAGYPPDEVLDQSVLNSYQGLFEIKEAGNGAGPGGKERMAGRQTPSHADAQTKAFCDKTPNPFDDLSAELVRCNNAII